MLNTPDMTSLGKKLATSRTAQNLTLTQLAAMLNVSPGSIANVESGCVMPSLDLLFSISSTLHIPIDYFLSDYLQNKKVALDYMLSETFSSSKQSKHEKDDLLTLSKTLLNIISHNKA